MTIPYSAIILIVSAYFTGSINTSIILFRLLGFSDPRAQYSKNAGVTNVYRQAGLFWAVIVLVLDIGKAALLSFLSIKFLCKEFLPYAGFMLIAGNRFPCFHDFKGGKGVAAYIGFAGMITPGYTIMALSAWVLVFALAKTPFIASLITILCLSFGFAVYLNWNPESVVGIMMIVIFLIFNHSQNIRELLSA